MSIVALLFSACQHEPELTAGTEDVCFDNQVLPVIQSSCAMSGCHTGNGELPALNTYEDIRKLVSPGKPVGSKLHKVLTANPNSESFMPPKPNSALSSAQIDIISLWILQGANHTSCEVQCDTVNVTFNGAILPITDTYCKGCHSGGSPSGGISLTDYATIKSAVESGRFMGAVEQLPTFSAMPKGNSKIPDCNITQLNKWITNGMPNN